MTDTRTLSERADALEHKQMEELGERLVARSLLYNLADGERSTGTGAPR